MVFAPLLAIVLTLSPVLSPGPIPSGMGPAEADPRAHVLVVGGARLGENGAHAFGGVEGGWLPGLLGLSGTLLYGEGDGYTSFLAGAGPALGHPLGPRLSAVLWGGGGWYREGLGEGVARELPVIVGGARLLVPTGPVRLSLGVIGLVGRHSSRTAPEPHGVRSLRLTLGVGR